MAFQQFAICKIVGVGKNDRRALSCCRSIDATKPIIVVRRKSTWESKSKQRDNSRYAVQYTNKQGYSVIGYLSGRHLKQIGVYKGKVNTDMKYELETMWG